MISFCQRAYYKQGSFHSEQRSFIPYRAGAGRHMRKRLKNLIEWRLPHQNQIKHNDAQNLCLFTIIHRISTVNAEDSCNSCLRISEGRQRFVSRFFC